MNIPASLHAATEPKDVRFHLVDRAGRRVRYRRFVEVDSAGEDRRSTTADADEDPGSMLETEWDPSAYADDYREELLRIIEEKTATEIVDEPAEPRSSAVEDLMEALRGSVEAARKNPRPRTKPNSEVG